MVIASLADPVVVLRKIISPKILGILKTLITVDQMAARQDIFVDLMVSVYRQIIADQMAARQDMFVDPMVSVYRQIIVGLMGVLQDRVTSPETVLFFFLKLQNNLYNLISGYICGPNGQCYPANSCGPNGCPPGYYCGPNGQCIPCPPGGCPPNM